MLPSISFENGVYQKEGKSLFLTSGEFHYFRVPKSDWRARLSLLKEAGILCAATYIPWLLHEPEEGVFDFDSAPWLQLEEFLKLCGEMGIYVICRPGPYQYSELCYNGLPAWLVRQYPQILAADITGRPLTRGSVSYLHPLFLEKARAWFDQVCPIIAKYTLQNGGSVLYVQVDNELMGIHDWYGSWDYNSETMGFGKENGRYSQFLQRRYDSITELGAAYGQAYSSFREVYPLAKQAVSCLADLRRVKDYQDFYFSVIAEYVSLLRGWIRNAGIDSPIIHNSASPYMNAFFRETTEQAGSDFLLGCDHYYNLNMDWEQNNPTPRYAAKVYGSNEMLRAMGYPATTLEMPAGSCSSWPPITAKDLRCCYLTNLAFGMKGVNYYIFTGGPNPPKSGNTTDLYDYCAPVSADGKIRDSYGVLKEFHNFLKEQSWLEEAWLSADFNIAMDFDHSRCQFEQPRLLSGVGGIGCWSFLRKGLMITALCQSFSPALIKIDAPELIRQTDLPLCIPTAYTMSAAAQQNIVRFLENGGKALLCPVIPEYDENYQPCTLLKDYLGCGSTVPCTDIPDNGLRLNVGEIQNVNITGRLFKTELLPGDAQAIASEETYQTIAGWEKPCGRGKAIWLGLQWLYTNREHGQMLEFLLQRMGFNTRRVECDNPNLWAVIRTNGKKRMLFVMNLFSAESRATLKVRDGNHVQEVQTDTLSGFTVKTWILD